MDDDEEPCAVLRDQVPGLSEHQRYVQLCETCLLTHLSMNERVMTTSVPFRDLNLMKFKLISGREALFSRQGISHFYKKSWRMGFFLSNGDSCGLQCSIAESHGWRQLAISLYAESVRVYPAFDLDG